MKPQQIRASLAISAPRCPRIKEFEVQEVRSAVRSDAKLISRTKHNVNNESENATVNAHLDSSFSDSANKPEFSKTYKRERSGAMQESIDD
jgi:hypothetical protein